MNRRWWLAAAIFTVTGCAGGCKGPLVGDDDDTEPFEACDAGDASFYRNASLAILGRRTFGEAELAGWMTIASNAEAAMAGSGRRAVMDAMMDLPEFRARWSEHFLDELRVPRVDDQDMRACWGARIRGTADAALAQYVRDNEATATGDGSGTFTMLDLMHSALAADDVSTVYRGHLFALVSHPIPAANVPAIEAELARRADYGNVFDAAYLNRDLVCMSCHNSEFSVTFDPDPALNRHWAMPGLFEKSVYGVSSGIEPERAHAVFRFSGFADNFGTARPWGWSGTQCGAYDLTPAADPAGVDAKFGTITGTTVSVYDLEASLKRGVDSLAVNGLVRDPDGTIPDPDQAFAYLVAASVVEGVWEEIAGSPLTIANYFPRNEASRDVLTGLTDSFVASHFSLRTLVTDILETPYFNRTPPELGCGAPYDMPAVYDPWTKGEGDPAMRGNSSADGVNALSGKVLVRAAHAAMNWPLAEGWTFPQTQGQTDFRRGVGIFLKSGERGFRGLDFQARLVWEERFGSCVNPAATPDYVDDLVAAAVAQNASVSDVVIALKDRLVNEAAIAPDERPALEALLGASLDAQASSVPEPRVRALCGVLLASPQFMLGGYSDVERRPVPVLSP